MTIEEKAERIILTVKSALRSKEAPSRPDAKEQLRLILDSEYGTAYKKEEAAKFMAECYPGAAVQTQRGVVLFGEDGAELEGVTIGWDGLADCVQECLSAGAYMTPAEEREYFAYAEASREIMADRLQTLLAENTRDSKCRAIMDCGAPAWDALLHDPDEFVRGCIAIVGDEQRQLELVSDPEPMVRQSLADHGTDKVRAALLEAGERDPSILKSAVGNGSFEVQAAAIERFWETPETLIAIGADWKPEAQRVLLAAEDPRVAILGINAANREQCQRLLETPGLGINEKMKIEWRLGELPEPGKASPVLQ